MASSKLRSPSGASVPPQADAFSDGLAWAATAKVLVPKPDEVTAYLNQHPDLAPLLPEICAQARQAFGQAAGLSLELYRDPEIDDRYLTLYIRQHPYDAGILEKIEAVSARFHDSLAAVSGHLLLAPDLRRP